MVALLMTSGKTGGRMWVLSERKCVRAESAARCFRCPVLDISHIESESFRAFFFLFIGCTASLLSFGLFSRCSEPGLHSICGARLVIAVASLVAQRGL